MQLCLGLPVLEGSRTAARAHTPPDASTDFPTIVSRKQVRFAAKALREVRPRHDLAQALARHLGRREVLLGCMP
jgi:hypothetical protein